MEKDKENDLPEEKERKRPGKDTKHPKEEEDDKVYMKFDTFSKELEENEIDSAISTVFIAEQNLACADLMEKNRKKHKEKSATALEEYENIKCEISLKLCQGILEMQEDITISKTKFTEMAGLFAPALACIKRLGKETIAIKDALDRLGSAIKDDCNNMERKELNKVRLPHRVEELQEKAKVACDKASHNIASAVKASGIKALLNIASLETVGAEIKTETDAFKADVDANITTYTGNYQSDKQSYEQALNDLCTADARKDMADLLKKGLNETLEFSKPDHDRQAQNIDDIVDKAEKNFNLSDGND